MKYPMYCIRDNKVGFMTPVIDTNHDTAIRNFAMAVNGQNDTMAFSPADFDLYQVGTFDSEKGMIEPMTPDLVVSGTSVFGAK